MRSTHILLTAIFVMFLFLLAHGATLALFTDSATSVSNTFAAASVFPTVSPSPTPLAVLRINEFVPNPSPNTNNIEWVEIYNPTLGSVDLTNWKIVDGNALDDDIDLSGIISSAGFIAFDHSDGWLNNGGDTITLLDSNGTMVDSITYSANPGADNSYGRDVDGTGSFDTCSTVTKGSSNNGSC